MSDHFAMQGKREGKTFSFDESRRLDGRAALADRSDGGAFSFSVSGSSPQGEEQTLNVCRLLVKRLNSLGATWGEPSLIELADVDCHAIDTENHENVLCVLVVQAVTDPQLWQKLNTQGFAQVSPTDASALAKQIEAAVKHKEVKIPANARSALTLALDATLVPALAFEHVIEEFHAQYGAWADSLGFADIWLIGPIDDLVQRLDNAE